MQPIQGWHGHPTRHRRLDVSLYQPQAAPMIDLAYARDPSGAQLVAVRFPLPETDAGKVVAGIVVGGTIVGALWYLSR